MQCPDDMELARWTDGQLPREQAEAVVLHLQECLECRLIVGEPADELLLDTLGEEGPVTLPPFAEIEGKLRASYHGWSEPDTSFLDPVLSDEFLDPVLSDALPVLMAADTENRAGTMTIPSYYGEGGRLVVTFRVDDESRVRAFFVSEEVERVRFRALRVGDRLFLGDADGRVVLSGVTAEEVLGCDISVPPVLATAVRSYPDLVSTGETVLELLPWGARAPEGPLRLRVTADASGLGLLLRLEGTAPEGNLVVVIADDRTAQVLSFVLEDPARCPLGAPAPEVVQFHLLGRS
jgi:hypothetical protein